MGAMVPPDAVVEVVSPTVLERGLAFVWFPVVFAFCIVRVCSVGLAAV